MPLWKLAVQTAALHLPLKTALTTARRLGVSAVELAATGDLRPGQVSQSAVRQIRHWLQEQELRVCALDFYTRRGYATPEEIDRRVEATKAALRLAHDLGAPFVVNHLGRLPPADAPGRKLLVEVLSDLGAYGQRAGATLLAETGSESGGDLRALLAELPQGALAVAFDPGNLVAQGFTPLDELAELRPYVWHVHAHDGVREATLLRGQDVPLGRGSIDFPALLAALHEADYRGYLSIERQTAAPSLTEFEDAVQFLQSLTA